MKKGIGKTISLITVLTLIFQMLIPIIPELDIEVLAADETSENTEEISRNYEIKEEETWDISKNRDGSVIAKWTLGNKTLTISGTGKMKDWSLNIEEDWHNTQYTKFIENVIIENGVTSIGNYAFSRCSSLRNISISEGLINIGLDAFYGCSSLESINIPGGVVDLETGFTENMFVGCSNLKTINVESSNKNYSSEDGVLFNKTKKKIICYPAGKKDIKEYVIPKDVTSIGVSAFEGCSGIERITIPEEVTVISTDAFKECSNLESITIPKGVTYIESNAFEGCSNLKNITIPKGVTYIGDSAFSGCSSLESITIPNSVTSIGGEAFRGCSSLESIAIPEGVTSIEYGAFRGCSSLESINISDNITNIGDYVFAECSSLKSITIPEGVTNIGSDAFSKCSSLESITIPEGVTNIGGSAFSGCSSLEHIIIPAGVTSIGRAAFNECIRLDSIDIPKGVTNIGEWAFNGCSSLRSITIPEGVISIGEWAFNECSSLESIIIPKGVTSIESSAFHGCSALKSIDISNSVTNIEEYTFYECSSLESITIPEGVTSIERGIFYGCTSLKSINIPDKVTNIGEYAFYGCSSLESITIPEGVTSIESNTFYGCSSLESITIPEGVTSIGNDAFYRCSNLENINIPEGVTNIGGSAFLGCSNLESIRIPETVINIGGLVFNLCDNLIVYVKANSLAHKYVEQSKVRYILDGEATDETTTNYMIKEEQVWDISKKEDGSVMAKWTLEDRTLTISGIGEMKRWSFGSEGYWRDTQYEKIIEKVIIEEGVTNIGSTAFEGCSGIESITIPEGVTSIEYDAFVGCNSLISIDIPKSVTNIRDRAFERCSSLESINVDKDNKNYTSENGILFNKEKTEIIHYPVGKKDIKEYIIPEGVANIGENAFNGCNSLENIIIPEGVTSIEGGAFEGCSSLENIIIPEGVTSIGGGAFEGCSSLENIIIPESVTNIGSSAFSGCSSLMNITIPKGITSIEDSVFEKCSNLKNMEIPEGVTSIEGGAFEGCSSLESINIPEGVTSIGNGAFYGCSSLKSIEIPEGVTSIGFDAFYGCSSLENITIPEGVTSIEGFAFYGCSSLERITIPEGVTSIGLRAFQGCSSLKSINIPKGITSIEYETFYGCSSLESINIQEGVTSIGEETFRGCSSLKSIDIPNSVTNIGVNAFYECSSLENINIPESVTYIGNSAFSRCSSLESINIQEGVTSIEENAFNGCENLTIYTNLNSEGHRYAEENKQAYIIDDEGPSATFTPNGSSNPQKGYTVKVNVKDNQEVVGVDEERLKYLWTQSEEEPAKESFIESFENGQNITKNEADGIWYLWVYAEDNLGNETITRGEGFNFDNTAPNVDVEYNTKLPAKSVLVTLTSNEEIQGIEGWTLSEDKKVMTKEYDENIGETITIRDLAGNETEASIEINNIDKTGPDVKVEYSTKELTRENVLVTLTSNEEIQEIEGWELSEDKKVLTKEYSANTKEIIVVEDLLENKSEVEIEINNIDKNGLIETIEYSTKNPTKENVKVTIFTNEEIEEIEGWELSENKKELTKEYSENEEETIVIRDIRGNELKINIKVENIDREEPKIQVEYSTKEITKDNVLVTVTSNEEIQEVEGWTLSSDKLELTKEYSQNTTETVTIKDLAGNAKETTVQITNIDKTVPTVNVTYSTKDLTKESVIVTITSNEQIQEVSGWTLSSDKLKLTKEYSQNATETVTIKDLAGNAKETTVQITNIDKIAPTVNMEYSAKSPTKENVTVTITSNEQIQEIEGWTLSSDKKTLTKEYTENTKETITIKDLVGNETQVNIEITNIDKTPDITVGDINQDGKIDVTDFLMLKRHLVAGNRNNWKLTGDNLLAADMNENGVVDITDMLMLKRIIVEDM